MTVEYINERLRSWRGIGYSEIRKPFAEIFRISCNDPSGFYRKGSDENICDRSFRYDSFSFGHGPFVPYLMSQFCIPSIKRNVIWDTAGIQKFSKFQKVPIEGRSQFNKADGTENKSFVQAISQAACRMNAKFRIIFDNVYQHTGINRPRHQSFSPSRSSCIHSLVLRAGSPLTLGPYPNIFMGLGLSCRTRIRTSSSEIFSHTTFFPASNVMLFRRSAGIETCPRSVTVVA